VETTVSHRTRVAVCGGLAAVLTSLCLTPLVHPAGWLIQAAIMLVAVDLLGYGLRRAGVPRPLALVGQLVLSLCLLTLGFARAAAPAGFLPVPGAVQLLVSEFHQGLADISEYTIPAPATTGLSLIMVGTVLAIGLIVDVLAASYGLAALAGLPLLALFSVGTGLHPQGSSWLWFLLAAGGYLTLLLAEGHERLNRWGRIFSGTAATLAGSTYSGTRPLARSGHRLGLIAVAAALAVPFLLPDTTQGLVNGLGTGSGQVITAVNPLASLQQTLNEPDNQLLFTYRTTSTDPSDVYLRIVDLDAFDGTSWQPSSQKAVAVPKQFPTAQGLTPAVQTTPFTTTVSVGSAFAENWLPLPYPATSVQATGDWRYEPDGGNLIGARGQTTRGIDYTVTSEAVAPTPDQLRAAGPAPAAIRKEYLGLPQDLPALVRADALTVTKGAATDYDKAVALQNWFADSGEFTYNTQVTSGTGSSAIVRFLTKKQGFCVHFAATMAAMARVLGIPARVAIGFTPGTEQADGTWQVGTKDAHAWPELYFQGAGWLRFEPTPSRGISPAYTETQPSGSTPAGSTAGSATGATPAPSASAAASCAGHLARISGCSTAPQEAPLAAGGGGGSGSSDAVGLAWIALGCLAGLALLLVVCGPGVWRAGRRRARLRGGYPAELWQELLDTAWDLGVSPPPDRDRAHAETPRRALARLTADAEVAATGPGGPGGPGLDEDARAAAERLAAEVERSLYGRPGGGGTARPRTSTDAADSAGVALLDPPLTGADAQPDLRADLHLVTTALRAAASGPARLRAALLPRSLRRG